jgi:hypothetical protein
MLLTAIVLPAMAVPAFATVAPDHLYSLNGSLADTMGGPALNLVGGATLGATGVEFDAGEGLALAGSAFANATDYTIALDFRFDSLPTRFSRILNMSSFGIGGPDDGLYIHEGDGLPFANVDYYSTGAAYDGGPEFTVGAQTSHHIVFSRGSATTSVYLDGADVFDLGSVSSSQIGSSILFFLDDFAENAPGFVSSICTYNGALGASDARAVSSGNCGAGTVASDSPEPSVWAMMVIGFCAIGSTLRRRRIDFHRT